jgi:hypothetical protein
LFPRPAASSPPPLSALYGYEAVAANQAFAFLCQSEDLLGLFFDCARVSLFDKPLMNEIAKIAIQS